MQKTIPGYEPEAGKRPPRDRGRVDPPIPDPTRRRRPEVRINFQVNYIKLRK